jgi:hypothetical protein
MSLLDNIPFLGGFFSNLDNWADKWERRAKWGAAIILIVVLTFLGGTML